LQRGFIRQKIDFNCSFALLYQRSMPGGDAARDHTGNSRRQTG
jgi:hypothetical protein